MEKNVPIPTVGPQIWNDSGDQSFAFRAHSPEFRSSLMSSVLAVSSGHRDSDTYLFRMFWSIIVIRQQNRPLSNSSFKYFDSKILVTFSFDYGEDKDTRLKIVGLGSNQSFISDRGKLIVNCTQCTLTDKRTRVPPACSWLYKSFGGFTTRPSLGVHVQLACLNSCVQ